MASVREKKRIGHAGLPGWSSLAIAVPEGGFRGDAALSYFFSPSYFLSPSRSSDLRNDRLAPAGSKLAGLYRTALLDRAGAHGNGTHPGPLLGPTTDLKSVRHTSTDPLPRAHFPRRRDLSCERY